MPVVESSELLRDTYRVGAEAYRKKRDELVEVLLLDIADLLDTPVRQLSLGQRMRCDLAAALLHAPPILFLDEPTIGLVAVSKLAVRDFVNRLNREGVTVLLTTHDMDDIEALCTCVMVIGSGKISPTARSRSCAAGSRASAGSRSISRPTRGPTSPTRPSCVATATASSWHSTGDAPARGADPADHEQARGARPVRRESADRDDHRAALLLASTSSEG